MNRILITVIGALLLCHAGSSYAQPSVSLVNIAGTPEKYSVAELNVSQGAGGLVINEIYIGTSSSLLTASDQFIELYNPQTTPQYLDGKMIVRFGNGGRLVSGVLQSPAEAWKFPGRPGGRTLVVQPGKFVVIAATAKNFTNAQDLSSADFETFTGSALLDQDNSSATNLSPVGASGLFVRDLTLSATQDAVVLTDGTDTTLTNGITANSVIDGVQYTVSATGTLPAVIDAGSTGGSALKLGTSMERKVKGVTTFNSRTDFELAPPSPGYQHGSQSTVNVKVTDILPLTPGRYVDYDAYATDTNGTIVQASKNRASYTIFSASQNFQGSSGVIWSRDTSNAVGGSKGTAADLHYRATAAGDLQAYADAAFMGVFIPASLASVITPPNQFVDYLKTSGGPNRSYAITTITQDITQSGVTATVKAVVTGSYLGVESVTVPAGKFDTAYKFGMKADVNVTAFGLPISNFSVTQLIWIVKGVGIVKTNLPAAKGSQLPLPGSERDMIAYGTRAVSGVRDPAQQLPQLVIYPNPARTTARLYLDAPVTEVVLVGTDVREVMRLRPESDAADLTIPLEGLADGVYYAVIHHKDGSSASAKLVVKH